MVLSLNSKRKCSPPSNAGNELSKIFGYGLPHLISMAVCGPNDNGNDRLRKHTHTHHIKDSNRKSSVEKCAEFVFNCYWFHPKLRDNSNTTTNNKNKQPKIVMPLSMIALAPSFARCVRRRYNINICKISEYFWDLSRLSRIFSSFLRRRQK